MNALRLETSQIDSSLTGVTVYDHIDVWDASWHVLQGLAALVDLIERTLESLVDLRDEVLLPRKVFESCEGVHVGLDL